MHNQCYNYINQKPICWTVWLEKLLLFLFKWFESVWRLSTKFETFKFIWKFSNIVESFQIRLKYVSYLHTKNITMDLGTDLFCMYAQLCIMFIRLKFCFFFVRIEYTNKILCYLNGKQYLRYILLWSILIKYVWFYYSKFYLNQIYLKTFDTCWKLSTYVESIWQFSTSIWKPLFFLASYIYRYIYIYIFL